jgi:hypothetical protein
MTGRNDRIAGDTPEIAALKRELHRQANGSLNAAIENGFWIEAISIAESLMSDRIESYFQKHHERRRITTLGSWSYELMKSDRLAKKDVELFKRVHAWAKKRNLATHELVKVSESHQGTWVERVASCKRVAMEGKRLSAEVNNWSRRKVGR